MLGNLKKKFSSVFQEGAFISENLHHQVRTIVGAQSTTDNDNGQSSQSLSRTIELQPSSDVNMAAGCHLLAKYENNWKEIHDSNEDNAQRAAEVAEQIEVIGQRTSEQRLVMTDLIVCLSGIPALVAKIQAGMEALKDVAALSDSCSVELERLEDLCEECHLQEFMLSKQFELEQYKQKKMADLEICRQKVAAEHQEKIRQYEQRLRRIQRERQAVFDDAFRGDLEEFKQKGMIPKIYKDPSNELAKLEEVDLEDTETKDALEEFLNG